MRIDIIEQIFIYIFYSILEIQPIEEDLFEKVENKKFIRDENLFYKNRFNKYDNDTTKHSKNTKVEIKNLYIKNFLLDFKTEIVDRGDSFFKNNFFKKLEEYISVYENVKISGEKDPIKRKELKKTKLKNKSKISFESMDNNFTPSDIFRVNNVKYNKLLNTIIYNDDMLSDNNVKTIKINKNFKDILDDKNKLLEYFKIISMAYDIIVKYYYLPTDLSQFEKDAYLSYYLGKFLERQSNQIELKYLNQNIPDIREELFTNDIKKLVKFEVFNPDENEEMEDLLCENINNIRNKIYKDENILQNEEKNILKINIEDSSILKEKCLRIFLIWNTLFITLFRKNYKYVRFLEKTSFSFMIVNDFYEIENSKNKDDLTSTSLFVYLFSRLFFLDKPASDDVDDSSNDAKDPNFMILKKLDKNIHNLKEIRVSNKLEENEVNTPINRFYNDLNDYLFNTNDENFEINLKENQQKSLNYYNIPNRFVAFYPEIFKILWSDLDLTTKKFLFFGYNQKFNSTFKIKMDKTPNNVIFRNLINDIIIDNSIIDTTKLKIIPFFKSEQRSHIFYFLKFPNDKFEETKKHLSLLKERIISNEDLDKIKSYDALFKFVNEAKFSVKHIYEIYDFIFKLLFTEIKQKILESIKLFDMVFYDVVNDNEDLFNDKDSDFRSKFTKFFKYTLSFRKFEVLSGIYFYILL